MIRIVGGKIEIRVGRIPRPFPAAVYAVTVWPFIFYETHVWDDECVQVHERYHWMDQMRWFVLPWFVVYLILWWRGFDRPFQGGGREHMLETEAYARQDAWNAAAAGGAAAPPAPPAPPTPPVPPAPPAGAP